MAVLLILMLAASGVPSPLYRVYQEEFGFSSGVLTTIFGIYSFALLISLLVVGGLSDHVGRRPVLIAAFVLEAASMALFLFADGVGWLLAARVVQGLATGALTSTLGASVLDLQHRDRPLGAFINSASPGLGLSIEMDCLARADVAPREVIRAATQTAARSLGIDGDRGTLQVGKRADLVILKADPLRDVKNVRAIENIYKNGRPATP